MNKGSKLNGKDLVSIGIYTAIYCVVMMIASFTGFIPIFIPLLAVICPIISGVVFMLFISKVKTFGMVTIMGVLIGLFMWVTGMGLYVVGVATLSGFLADLIMKSGNYASVRKSIIAHGVFCIWVAGNMLPFYIGREKYLEAMVDVYHQEYVDTLAGIMTNALLPVLIVSCVVCGIIGGIIGAKMCKKHFSRAGIM